MARWTYDVDGWLEPIDVLTKVVPKGLMDVGVSRRFPDSVYLILDGTWVRLTKRQVGLLRAALDDVPAGLKKAQEAP